MTTVASQPPVGFTSGVSVDQDFQPLNLCGVANPFFYHSFSDDFDVSPGVTGWYTTTGSTGTLAGAAGVGGLALFTTGAAAGNFNYVQLSSAGFTANVLPKKLFYVARIQLAAVTTSTFVLGLIQDTVTPLTVTDGIWFSKAAASSQIVLNVAIASAVTSVNIPTTAYTLANNVNIDLAFQVTRQGDVLAFVDSQLVGYVPQSNINTTNGPQNAGAVARILAPTMPTVPLGLTAVVSNGATAAATTMTMDFHGAFQER